MAQLGPPATSAFTPLLGEKRTSACGLRNSVYDEYTATSDGRTIGALTQVAGVNTPMRDRQLFGTAAMTVPLIGDMMNRIRKVTSVEHTPPRHEFQRLKS